MSEDRTPECTECGADYRLPAGIPKDPQKVPLPTRGKSLTKPPAPTKSQNHQVQPKVDKKDEEIRRLRQINKELKQKTSAPCPEETHEVEYREQLKELKQTIN